MAKDRSRRRDDESSSSSEEKRRSPPRKEPRKEAKADNGKTTKENREPKLEPRKDRDAKPVREAKESRYDDRPSRREKEPKEVKEAKVAKEARDSKDAKASKETRDAKDSKDAKMSKETRDSKDSKDAKASKDRPPTREATDTREPRPARDSRPAKEEKPAREHRENDRDHKEIEERKELLRKRMEELKKQKEKELLSSRETTREDIDEALKVAMRDRDRALKAVATATLSSSPVPTLKPATAAASSTPAASSDAPASRLASAEAGAAKSAPKSAAADAGSSRSTARSTAARPSAGVTAVNELRDVSLGGSISDSSCGISSSGSTLSSGAGKKAKDVSGKKSRKKRKSSDDDGESQSGEKKRRREDAGLRPASGFSQTKGSTASSSLGPITYGPAPNPSSGAIVPLTEKVKGLLDRGLQSSLLEDALRLKQAMGVSKPGGKDEDRDDGNNESHIRMPPRLHENLLCPEFEQRLLKLTGLTSCGLNEDGLVVIRASSKKGLAKALGQLRRVAYHCQWGCSRAKVGQMLNGKPAKPLNTMVVRLAATSSRLQTFESKLTHNERKLRIGTQAGECQLVVGGVPGLSRTHCTITFEPEKGACYVQDLSTNGTYLNGRKLPRPPFKNIQDARVRCFHGDELFFRLRSNEAEELGYLINLVELS